jgi:uncharacterized protein YecT (DUF1311 family)
LLRKGLALLSSLLLICLVFALVSACVSPQRDSVESSSRIVPSEWKPSLEQVQASIQNEFEAKAQKSQQYLNLTSQNLSDLADARLFITYTLLMQNLDGKEQRNLFDEQKNWLAKRNELAQSAVVSKGGSLSPLEYASGFRQATEKRLAELEERLAQVRDKKNSKRKEK